jgi:hypothetical protein
LLGALSGGKASGLGIRDALYLLFGALLGEGLGKEGVCFLLVAALAEAFGIGRSVHGLAGLRRTSGLHGGTSPGCDEGCYGK